MTGQEYDQENIYTIYYINIICSGLSILTSLVIFLLFFTTASFRSIPFRFIFYLTLADFGTAVGLAIPY